MHLQTFGGLILPFSLLNFFIMTVEMATLELETTENLVENTLVTAFDGDEPMEEETEEAGEEEEEAGEQEDTMEDEEEAAS